MGEPLPIIKNLLKQLEGKPIVATIPSPEPRGIIHNGELVGLLYANKTIQWFDDTPNAKEAKKQYEDGQNTNK